MSGEEYRCLSCGHPFPAPLDSQEIRCPRCGGENLERNPWLLGSPQAQGLTSEDYFCAGLKP